MYCIRKISSTFQEQLQFKYNYISSTLRIQWNYTYYVTDLLIGDVKLLHFAFLAFLLKFDFKVEENNLYFHDTISTSLTCYS